MKELKVNIKDYLLENEWREFKDVTKDFPTISFYKRFDTKTVCRCNSNKKGIQIIINYYPAKRMGLDQLGENYEMELVGELADGTWIKLFQWSMPKDVKEGITKIQRLLATWEFISNYS
jgi:hypothetical protein